MAVNMGRRIQQSFLPRHLPKIPGYDVAAWWRPAESVSGDYYDVIPLPDGRWAWSSRCKRSRRRSKPLMASVRHEPRLGPDELRSIPNRIPLAEMIAPDLEDGRFLTFLLVALDPARAPVDVLQRRTWTGPALPSRHGIVSGSNSTSLPLGFLTEFGARDGLTLIMGPGDLLVLRLMD